MPEPLRGLERNDAQHLLITQGLQLSEALTTELYARTEGNAELLTLAVQALRNSKEPAQLIEQLATSDNIEHYLLTQVDANLSKEERAVMNGVAILLGHPVTAQEIESTKATKNIRRLLIFLTNRYLLTTALDKTAKRYVQHAIVQAFYYDLLNNEDRRVMHQRVAYYYETTEQDPLKAALHYVRACEHEKAVTLATTDIFAALGRGNAQILQRLFNELDWGALNPTLQANVEIARGEIFHFLGEKTNAQMQYETALVLLKRQADSVNMCKLRAYVAQKMGELVWAASPQMGLEWFSQGLTSIVNLPESEVAQRRAALHIQSGAIYAYLSRFAEAEAAIQQGLALVDNEVSPLIVDAFMNLSLIYSSRGQLVQVRQSTQQAIALCEQLHDPYRHFKLLAATALGKEAVGDWPGAQADHRTALASVDAVGYTVGRVYERINLGYLLVRLEQLDEAAEHLQTALALAQASQLHEPTVMIHINLAHVAFHHQDFTRALDALQQAESLAARLGIVDPEPEIAYLRAQVWLVQGKLEAARQDAEAALQQAVTLEKAVEEGIALRVLGQILTAEGKRDEAATTFDRSLALLDGADYFEFTRTQQYKENLFSTHPIL